jgi:hypothetical protein
MEQLRTPSEIQIQRQIWETIWKEYKDARRLLFHVPNESTYNNSQQASSGVIPGVPDMLFAWAGITWYIELKDDAGRISDSQKIFHSNLDRQGIKVWVFYSAIPAICFIRDIINGLSIVEITSAYCEYISPFSNGDQYETILADVQEKKKKARARRAGK